MNFKEIIDRLSVKCTDKNFLKILLLQTVIAVLAIAALFCVS
jgi:hypothetical protein